MIDIMKVFLENKIPIKMFPGDIYSITSMSGERICALYISPYQSTISNTAPKGFKFKEGY